MLVQSVLILTLVMEFSKNRMSHCAPLFSFFLSLFSFLVCAALLCLCVRASLPVLWCVILQKKR